MQETNFDKKHGLKFIKYLFEIGVNDILLACPCGAKIMDRSKYNHIQTKKHLRIIEQLKK